MKNDQEARDSISGKLLSQKPSQFSKKDSMKRIGETPLVRKDGTADFNDKI